MGPRTWAALRAPVLTLGPGAGDQAGGDTGASLQRRLAADGSSPGPSTALWRAHRSCRQAVPKCPPPAGDRDRRFPHARASGRARAIPSPVNVLPRKSAPSATRSDLTSRPTGSAVAPAPREVERVAPTECSAHRPTGRGRGREWMIALVGWLRAGVGTPLLAAHRFPQACTPPQQGPVRPREQGGRRCQIGGAGAQSFRDDERRLRSRRPNQRDPDSHQRASRQCECGWH